MRRLYAAAACWLLTNAAYAAESAPKEGMPQLNFATYASQLFWLAVFFALFYLFMWIVALPRVGGIIALRQARISGDLGHATAARSETDRLSHELDESLNGAREQSRTLIEAAKADSRARASEADAKLSVELARRVDTAEANIAASLNAALDSIGTIAAGIVAEALPKLADVPVSADEARRSVDHLTLTGA
jgi:F-type H+-transporting ATPase subunit b